MDRYEDRVMDDICNAINEYAEDRKNHELHVEISLAWDDEDEFEHEGYYTSIADAIAALTRISNLVQAAKEDMI